MHAEIAMMLLLIIEQLAAFMFAAYTNLPQCLAEELTSCLPPLPFIQAIVEQTGVVFHRIGFLKDPIYQIVCVDIVLYEGV